jgi:type IV secretory pathway VirB4 component
MAVDKTGSPTQDFVPIKEVRDGVVILKDSSMRLVLLVSSLNFALKSADEQMAILMQFQNFLNSLDFHIQIFVQSRKLDIRPYLRTLEERIGEQSNDLLKVQTREYIEFIKKFTETVDIMSKKFFVVVPYSPPPISGLQKSGLLSGILGRKQSSGNKAQRAAQDFEEYRTQLEQRAAVVSQGFSGLGLRVAPLGTEELVELYFKMFNPGESTVPSMN